MFLFKLINPQTIFIVFKRVCFSDKDLSTAFLRGLGKIPRSHIALPYTSLYSTDDEINPIIPIPVLSKPFYLNNKWLKFSYKVLIPKKRQEEVIDLLSKINQ